VARFSKKNQRNRNKPLDCDINGLAKTSNTTATKNTPFVSEKMANDKTILKRYLL
jgi:hypothetical protein